MIEFLGAANYGKVNRHVELITVRDYFGIVSFDVVSRLIRV